MTIKGTEGMSIADIKAEIAKGGKFVFYEYCISIFIMTFRRRSGVYFIKAGESAVNVGIGYTLLSLVAGWWGFPWGPIYTITSVFTNLKGGKDITIEMMMAYN